MGKLDKMLTSIAAFIVSAKALKADLSACRAAAAAKDTKIANLQLKVDDLEAVLAEFQPSQL